MKRVFYSLLVLVGGFIFNFGLVYAQEAVCNEAYPDSPECLALQASLSSECSTLSPTLTYVTQNNSYVDIVYSLDACEGSNTSTQRFYMGDPDQVDGCSASGATLLGIETINASVEGAVVQFSLPHDTKLINGSQYCIFATNTVLTETSQLSNRLMFTYGESENGGSFTEVLGASTGTEVLARAGTDTVMTTITSVVCVLFSIGVFRHKRTREQ